MVANVKELPLYKDDEMTICLNYPTVQPQNAMINYRVIKLLQACGFPEKWIHQNVVTGDCFLSKMVFRKDLNEDPDDGLWVRDSLTKEECSEAAWWVKKAYENNAVRRADDYEEARRDLDNIMTNFKENNAYGEDGRNNLEWQQTESEVTINLFLSNIDILQPGHVTVLPETIGRTATLANRKFSVKMEKKKPNLLEEEEEKNAAIQKEKQRAEELKSAGLKNLKPASLQLAAEKKSQPYQITVSVKTVRVVDPEPEIFVDRPVPGELPVEANALFDLYSGGEILNKVNKKDDFEGLPLTQERAYLMRKEELPNQKKYMKQLLDGFEDNFFKNDPSTRTLLDAGVEQPGEKTIMQHMGQVLAGTINQIYASGGSLTAEEADKLCSLQTFFGKTPAEKTMFKLVESYRRERELDLLLEDPMNFWRNKQLMDAREMRRKRDAQRFGNNFDSVVFTGQVFEDEYILYRFECAHDIEDMQWTISSDGDIEICLDKERQEVWEKIFEKAEAIVEVPGNLSGRIQ